MFQDRHDAGARLARALHELADASDTIVLAHTPSSVPVAYEIATRLGLPLDLLGSAIELRAKHVLVVDDGECARAMPGAFERIRACGATSIMAVVAVASPRVFEMLHACADELVCGLTPQHLFSLDAWYARRDPPSDEDIRQLLDSAAQNLALLRGRNFLSEGVDT